MCLAFESLRVLEASHTTPAPRSCSELSTGYHFVIPRADATSIDMQIICEGKVAAVVCSNALSRSPLLADMHELDADGRVPVPCHAKTWRAWLTDDPSELSPDAADLMLDVIRVRSVYSQERCKRVGCFHVRLDRERSSNPIPVVPLMAVCGKDAIRDKL
jgi:hypothetical protein